MSDATVETWIAEKPATALDRLVPLRSLGALVPLPLRPDPRVQAATPSEARLRTRVETSRLILAAVAALACLLVGALSVRLAQAPVPRVAAPPAPAEPPLPVWTDIPKPVQIFDLEAPEFAGAPQTYTARRHVGGGREDVLTLGRLAGASPAMRLRLFRRTGEPADQKPLLASLAREAADAGLSIDRIGLPTLVLTRFGAFELAEVALTRDGSQAAPCSGFRLAVERPALSVSGLVCGKAGEQLQPAAVGCLLERLDVVSARDDRALIDFFAASELRRNTTCAGARLGPDGAHAAWLDERPVVHAGVTSAAAAGAALSPAAPKGRHRRITSLKRVRRR